MSLEIDYIRPYQRIEPGSLQNSILKNVPYNIKSIYLDKITQSMISERVEKIVPYSGECECQLDYRSKGKDKPWVATIYHPPLSKNHKKN